MVLLDVVGQCVTGHPTKEFVPVNETRLVLVRLNTDG